MLNYKYTQLNLNKSNRSRTEKSSYQKKYVLLENTKILFCILFIYLNYFKLFRYAYMYASNFSKKYFIVLIKKLYLLLHSL